MPVSSHFKRLVTALVLLLILGVVAYTGGLAVRAALFLLAALGMWEFYSFFWEWKKNIFLKAAAFVCAALLLMVPQPLFSSYLHLGLSLIFCLMGVFFLIHYSLSGDKAVCSEFMVAVAGLIYLPLVLRFFITFTPAEIFLVLAAAFFTDTAAYYAGSWIGKHRIWPSISPKKTWEGSLAGMLATFFAVTVIGLIWGRIPWWQFMLMALALNPAAQLGDFFESAIKRRCNIKDSGNILPGHGGILDRIDSLLFVVPVYALISKLFNPF